MADSERPGETSSEFPIDMDGRRFDVIGSDCGAVTLETVFQYSQESNVVWARYAGGKIRLGYLVGANRGRELACGYTQLLVTGEMQTGKTTATIEELDAERVRLHETWRSDSPNADPASGRRTLEQERQTSFWQRRV